MTEVLHGNASGNQLNVTADKTQAYGLSGNDTIISDGKSEVLLIGGSGDDSLVMTGGKGTLSGGRGADTFELTYSADKTISAVIEDFDPANDKIVVNFEGDSAPQLSSSISGDDVVWRDGDGLLNFTLKGVRDNDYFDGDASDEAWEVLRLTNNEREKQNLPLLTLAQGLTKAAQIRSGEIAELGGESALTNHNRPDGTPYYTVLDDKYFKYGENLDAGATAAKWVMDDWIKSESHYDNIVRSDYKKLGVGYYYYDKDPSDQRFYWAQMFADSLNAVETVSTADLLTANKEINAVSKFITLNDSDNTYTNDDYGATIAAGDGADAITNNGLIVSISGGAGDDSITNSGNFATISAGSGSDSIINSGANALIQYGGGNDSIYGFRADSTLNISGDEYTPATVGNDVVVAVGNDSIKLVGAASLATVNIDGTRSKLFILTEDKDIFVNNAEGATIGALSGNDEIRNLEGSNVVIDGGNGNNYILNENGQKVLINTGIGNDSITNRNSNVTINSGAGDDSIGNYGASTIIDAGTGNDSIDNTGDSVTINADADNDNINNSGNNVSIAGGAGDDSLYNSGLSATINGNSGNNYIENSGSNTTIDGGAGNDSINNNSENVSIEGGAGADSIDNTGSNVTIAGGAGDDSLYNSGLSATINGNSGKSKTAAPARQLTAAQIMIAFSTAETPMS